LDILVVLFPGARGRGVSCLFKLNLGTTKGDGTAGGVRQKILERTIRDVAAAALWIQLKLPWCLLGGKAE